MDVRVSTFLRWWDRIVYGRTHRAKWAALEAIRAKSIAAIAMSEIARKGREEKP